MANKKDESRVIDYTQQLNKIFTCLVILIVILLINTLLLTISLGEVNIKTDDTEETEQTMNTAEYDVSMFEEVDASKYAELYKKDELVLTYFGRSDCGYCIQFLPTLQEVQQEYNLKVYYFDINKLNTEGANIIYALDDKYKDTLGRTPMVTITKNNSVVDMQMGATSHDVFVEFLKKHNVIK